MKPSLKKSRDLHSISQFRPNSKFSMKLDSMNEIPIDPCGEWDPQTDLYIEEDEVLEGIFKDIYDKGKRPQWEMKSLIPKSAVDDEWGCSIGDGVDILESGDFYGAIQHMEKLIKLEPLCIDAYAHLGTFYFNHAEDRNDIVKSRDYYKQGVTVALKSIGDKIHDVFQWGLIENRPFLRSLVGLGLSLWRLNKFDDALYIMKLLVWLNPSDNQGARFLIHPIENKEEWSSDQG